MDRNLGQRHPSPGLRRRRLMCVLDAGCPAPAAIREVSARGAFLETNARPPLGASAVLRHPMAGMISGQVSAHRSDGIAVAFRCDAASTGFALAVIAAGIIQDAA